MVIHNEKLKPLIKSEYTKKDIHNILSLLNAHGTFDFRALPNGLFPAVPASEETGYTGYSSVWVRDNMHVAYAHYVTGKEAVAVKTLHAMMEYFLKHTSRFENIVFGKSDFNNPMERPHVRFDGETLSEFNQKWAHAQNDALGYFLWLYCKAVSDGHIVLNAETEYMLHLFARYFKHIEYWQDEDSGHWEEVRKISASSMGTVVAGLKQLAQLHLDGRISKTNIAKTNISKTNIANTNKDIHAAPAFLEQLIHQGLEALYSILPYECRQEDALKHRRYDAALLFLIYPLNVLSPEMAEVIISDVTENLQGEYGIKRYVGDSYWAADYKKKLSENVRTADFSDSLAQRDALLQAGEEAQWCIFDSTLSTLYGVRYAAEHNPEFLKLQTHYLNRSLGQLTCANHPRGQLQCPESYYLEDGHYVTNDIVPLLWAGSNLRVAMEQMKKSLHVGAKK